MGPSAVGASMCWGSRERRRGSDASDEAKGNQDKEEKLTHGSLSSCYSQRARVGR
jgi:hypothetical protein